MVPFQTWSKRSLSLSFLDPTSNPTGMFISVNDFLDEIGAPTFLHTISSCKANHGQKGKTKQVSGTFWMILFIILIYISPSRFYFSLFCFNYNILQSARTYASTRFHVKQKKNKNFFKYNTREVIFYLTKNLFYLTEARFIFLIKEDFVSDFGKFW